ncbi:MAG: ABC transporter permease [Spirochaetia bacterium]|nr:ABC transporter permease [Spirochaetia bacterium]
MAAVLSIISPRFLTKENLSNVLWSISIVGIMVSGTIYSPITSGVDLSVGSLAALSGVLFAKFMITFGFGLIPSILLTIAIACTIGFIHGLIITRINVPPLIITMAAKTYLFGIAMLISKGEMIPIMEPSSFMAIGGGKILGFPIPIFIMVIFILLSHILLKKTAYGRKALAVGANPVTAELSGIDAMQIQTIAYILSAFTAAIAGLVLCSISQLAYALLGQGLELEVITAIVLGGTPLGGGGFGTVFGALIGTVMVGFIGNGLNLMNVPSSFHPIVTGLVIISALALNENLRMGSGTKLKKAKL